MVLHLFFIYLINQEISVSLHGTQISITSVLSRAKGSKELNLEEFGTFNINKPIFEWTGEQNLVQQPLFTSCCSLPQFQTCSSVKPAAHSKQLNPWIRSHLHIPDQSQCEAGVNVISDYIRNMSDTVPSNLMSGGWGMFPKLLDHLTSSGGSWGLTWESTFLGWRIGILSWWWRWRKQFILWGVGMSWVRLAASCSL